MLAGKIIGIGGFPHSEICGSKVAHTSPQLIAACHVLHRLYAPRHPPNALTSRLRVHTTNDNAGSVRRPTRNSAEQRARYIGVDVHISALLSGAPSERSNLMTTPMFRRQLAVPKNRKPTPSRHRFEKPIHNVKKLRATPAWPLRRADLVASSLDILPVVEPIGIEPMTSSLQS